MRRAWLTALLGTSLLALAACDEDSDRKPREARQPIPEPAPVAVKSERAAALTPESDLKDAVGPASPASDNGRVLFDGDKNRPATLSNPAGVRSVSGPDDAKRAQALINAPAKRATLAVKEPPSPSSASSKPLASPVSLRQAQAKEESTAGSPSAVPGSATSSAQGRVLFIGDSLSTKYFGFGPAMYQHLTKTYPNAQVDFYAYGGSSPNWFLPRIRNITSPNVYAPGHDSTAPAPKLDKVLAKDTKVVVVELGTNLIDWKAINDKHEGKLWGVDSVRQMAQLIHDNGSACLWIGPPDMTGSPGKSDPAIARASIAKADAALEKAVSGLCAYIKVSDKTHYAGGDGIHQNKKTGEAWAAALIADPAFRLP